MLWVIFCYLSFHFFIISLDIQQTSGLIMNLKARLHARLVCIVYPLILSYYYLIRAINWLVRFCIRCRYLLEFNWLVVVLSIVIIWRAVELNLSHKLISLISILSMRTCLVSSMHWVCGYLHDIWVWWVYKFPSFEL